MPSISVLPAYPIAGKPCRITAAVAPAGGKIRPGNAVRIWCTNAPPGSRLRADLDASQASRIVIATLEVGKPYEFTPDKGGGYALLLEEIQRGAGFSGGYEGDPRGAPSEDIVADEETTLHVASQLTCKLGFGSDLATLRIFVAGESIIATTSDQHGLATPTIDLGGQPTAKARAAAESSAVRGALADLVGSATTALGSPAAVIADLIGEYEDHRERSGSHADPDESNTIDADSYASLDSLTGQREALSKLREALTRHIKNVDPTSDTQASGTASYHNGISWSALPLANIGAGDDALSVMVAAADTWRAYEAHRVSSVHTSADNSNRADALPPLLELHRQFVAYLADLSPATPPTGHAAAALLANAAGFKDA
jgi:hypothetical protein